MKKGMSKPLGFGSCRRCRCIIEATESGFLAVYCAQCDPNNEPEGAAKKGGQK